MSKGLSITAYARHRGVSHVAVLKAIKVGRIEKDGTIDPAKADAAWERNTNQAQKRKATKPSAPPRHDGNADAPVGPPIVNSGPSFAQSRAIKEAYNARLAKLAYEEKSGALVKTDSVKVAWFNTLHVVACRICRIALRLLATESDPKIVRDLLEEELRTSS